MKIYSRVCLIILFAFAQLSVAAEKVKPLSQQLYEDQIQRQCDVASETEIGTLARCLGSLQRDPKQNLDELSEFLTLKPIASEEAMRLQCLHAHITKLKDNDDLLELAVNKTCENKAEKLELLRDAIENQDYYRNQISTYKSLNDRSLRRVSDEEYEKNSELLKYLKSQSKMYGHIEESIRSSDVLLSSPKIFDEVKSSLKKGFLFSGEAPLKVCEQIRKNAKKLLSETAQEVDQARRALASKINNDSDWPNDESFKRALWNSNSGQNVVRKLTAAGLKNSTYCRMEGRYGQGAETRDKILNLTTLAMGGVGPALGRIAILATNYKRVDAAVLAARGALGVDVTVGTVLGASQTMKACQKKIDLVSEEKSCRPLTNNEFKGLFYKKLEADDCLLAASLTVVSGGLSAVGIRTALLDRNGTVGREMAGRLDITRGLFNQVARNKIELGDTVLVMRSSNEFSTGVVNFIEGDFAYVRVKTIDALGNEVRGTKRVSLSQLKNIGSEVLVPRTAGGYSQARISAYYDDGTVRVDFVSDGKPVYKIIDPKRLKDADIVSFETPTYTFKSLKVSDYTTRGGQKVVVDYNSPSLKLAAQQTMRDFESAGVRAVPIDLKPSTRDMEQAAASWLETVKRFESKNRNQNYDQMRNKIIEASNGAGDLGQILACEAAVCRELSIMGSVALSELGYTTRVVKGNIGVGGGGGHAWIEFLDPRTGDVVGLVDNNYMRRFYSDPKQYYKETRAVPIDYTVVASPR